MDNGRTSSNEFEPSGGTSIAYFDELTPEAQVRMVSNGAIAGEIVRAMLKKSLSAQSAVEVKQFAAVVQSSNITWVDSQKLVEHIIKEMPDGMVAELPTLKSVFRALGKSPREEIQEMKRLLMWYLVTNVTKEREPFFQGVEALVFVRELFMNHMQGSFRTQITQVARHVIGEMRKDGKTIAEIRDRVYSGLAERWSQADFEKNFTVFLQTCREGGVSADQAFACFKECITDAALALADVPA